MCSGVSWLEWEALAYLIGPGHAGAEYGLRKKYSSPGEWYLCVVKKQALTNSNGMCLRTFWIWVYRVLSDAKDLLDIAYPKAQIASVCAKRG